jgi:uncharacterized membrane-anchored protein YhcB (DUF1043 family)
MKAVTIWAAFGLGLVLGLTAGLVVADEVRGGAQTAWYGR